MLLAKGPAFFTISHFDTFAAVLVQLNALGKKALRGALVDAWLVCAPTDIAEEFLKKARRTRG